MKYDWKAINDRLVAAIRPASSAVSIKFIKEKKELDAIPGLKYWRVEGTGVCKLIGLVAYWNEVLALESEYCDKYCGCSNGILKRDEWWMNGVPLNSDPIKWHGLQKDSAAHAQAMLPDLPSDDHIAIAAAPMASGAIEEPDAIIISADPGAAFHLFAALVEKDHQTLLFPFRGESTCADTWCRTATTGKPGVSMGCRGDRCQGGLGTSEVRFSMSTKDLLKALDGVDRLKSDGIYYPYYPDGVVEFKDL